MRTAVLVLLSFVLWPAHGWAADYNVGPGKQYTSIGAVPWYALNPGDTVYIHYRATPYNEKFLISSRGTASQWIRVLGVLGPNGERPIISGNNATTGTNMHHHWQEVGANGIQQLGLVQLAVHAGDTAPLPGYIEIANLQIQDAYTNYRFTAENGTSANFDGFAACIYARSAQHILIRDNILTNCGQGFYNWTAGGDGAGGPGTLWWNGAAQDITLRGNYFYNNGSTNSYTEHQTYTEADGVTIEYNRYGPNRAGAMGSQLKDRSSGTVIRYNYFEMPVSGWVIDLVEPQEGWALLGAKATYRQAFVYGNIIINKTSAQPNFVHWNEDHQQGIGRATLSGGKLFFYSNTVVSVLNQSDVPTPNQLNIFNTTWGGYDCPPGALAGVIDARNNIFAVLPRTAGSAVPTIRFAYCSSTKIDFGKNWVSPGWVLGTTSTVTGTTNLVSPAGNNPGFVNMNANDVHLVAGSSAIGIGGALAGEITSNSLGLNMSPTMQYVYHTQVSTRASAGAGSDSGALASGSGGGPPGPPAPQAPANLLIIK